MSGRDTPVQQIGSWKIRRRVMFLSLAYLAVHISWIVFFAVPTSLLEQAMIAFIGAATAIIGSYVFGAVWDDNSRRRHSRPRDFEHGGEGGL